MTRAVLSKNKKVFIYRNEAILMIKILLEGAPKSCIHSVQKYAHIHAEQQTVSHTKSTHTALSLNGTFSFHILTMMNNNKQHTTFIGGAAVHKELQGFAAFVAYQGCHQSGASVTNATLKQSVADQYFGDNKDPDSIGLAEQLVSGEGIFRSLYTQSSSLNPLHTTTNEPSSSTTLVMKPSLHCLGGHITIPVGGANGILLPLLLRSKLRGTPVASNDAGYYIKARTLFDRAQEVVKNGKKALACVMAQDSPYKDYVKTGNLPSGMNHDDYLQFA
jgi:hypothetical protein